MANSIEYRFICDVMLGRLAKWLRILGFDTLYFRVISDGELVKIAKQEQRIILTRDRALIKNKMVENAFLINSNDIVEQLEEFLKLFKNHFDKISAFSSRCVNCNSELHKVQKEAVLNEAPEYIIFNNNFFLKCYNCGKIFWDGSHKKMIDRTIREIFGNIRKRTYYEAENANQS
ncbi:MAG: Mut7-C RNAse domain-containing protein [Thermodesulfovibrionales bacterium]|nr:Mut7-C RNAse domain-containing protein [Thermodesulfovibrionales bacterium]